MRRLAYLNADIFLITFSVVEPASYDNAIHKVFYFIFFYLINNSNIVIFEKIVV